MAQIRPRPLLALFHCMVRFGTVHFWGVFHWVLYLVPDTFLVPPQPRFQVLRAKEEGDLPACHQRSVQKPASLMVWGGISAYGMGSLRVLEGTMNAERYIMV